MAQTAALVSQPLRLILCCASTGCRSLAMSALVFCLVGGPAALAGCLFRRSLLATKAKHSLEALHSSSSTCDTSKRTHGIRVAARTTRSLPLTFAAGPLSLSWGRVHVHRVDDDGIVSARRCSQGFKGLRGVALGFATRWLWTGSWGRRLIVKILVVVNRIRVWNSCHRVSSECLLTAAPANDRRIVVSGERLTSTEALISGVPSAGPARRAFHAHDLGGL